MHAYKYYNIIQSMHAYVTKGLDNCMRPCSDVVILRGILYKSKHAECCHCNRKYFNSPGMSLKADLISAKHYKRS